MKLLVFLLILCSYSSVFAQTDSTYSFAYLDKSTRFAWLTYGGDFNLLTGGSTQLLINQTLESTSFGTTLTPRLTIGGVHFWGHVDFYVTFPLSFLTYQDTPSELEDLEVYQGVETGARLYPLKLQKNHVSPFLGMSFRRLRFSQESKDSPYSNGTPNYGRFIQPIQVGLTYTTDNWHITASSYYSFQDSFDYYISPTQSEKVTINPFSLNISFLKYIDSDAALRKPKAVASINKSYEFLKQENALSSWFIGLGPSSALQISKSSFLRDRFPFFYDQYAASILPDITFGRYFYTPDMNINLSYRTYGNTYEGFDNSLTTRRHSIGIESVKFLFNWLGFVPFAGTAITFEQLQTTVNETKYSESKAALGFVFGWDIRVTQTGSSLLRTNLRYFPNLHMNIDGRRMMFDDLEFNFIQWVYFIGRGKAYKK